jgi:hypothetical protein
MLDLWNSKKVPAGQCLDVRAGHLSLSVFNGATDWHIGHHYNPGQLDNPGWSILDKKTDRERWQRWLAPASDESVTLTPVLPDRSVVVRSESPLRIPQNTELLLFIGIPVWVKPTVGPGGSVPLGEFATVVLSNTWFGEMETGELCYSLKSAVRTAFDDLAGFPYKAACPVSIHNRAVTALEFERLSVPVMHLSVYRGKSQLWTNELEVTYTGDRKASQIEIHRHAPAFEKPLERVSGPRRPLEGGKLKKTFGSLFQFSGLSRNLEYD